MKTEAALRCGQARLGNRGYFRPSIGRCALGGNELNLAFMSKQVTDVTVIGCGVIGLSSGIALLEAGLKVTIVARELPPRTTSNVAAALWYPYKAEPPERVLAWGAATLKRLSGLAAEPQAGVHLTTVVELLRQPAPDPWWRPAVPSFRRATPAERPPGYVDGYAMQLPLMETPVYMRYVLARFRDLGGQIEQATVHNLMELARPGRIIVNCTGLGARELVGDRDLYPIWGQIVRVRPAGPTPCLLDDSDPDVPTYIIPRIHDCILGGVAQREADNLAVSAEDRQSILARCYSLVPTLAGAEILEELVGLRPGRPTVRLERERLPGGGTVIHNYGHGGAGFTLSWGCAAEVLRLALERV